MTILNQTSRAGSRILYLESPANPGRYSDDISLGDVIRSPRDIDIDLDHSALSQYISDAMSSLSDTERLVVQLFYFLDYTTEDIGKVIDRGQTTVCNVKREALRKLGAALERWDVDLYW